MVPSILKGAEQRLISSRRYGKEDVQSYFDTPRNVSAPLVCKTGGVARLPPRKGDGEILGCLLAAADCLHLSSRRKRDGSSFCRLLGLGISGVGMRVVDPLRKRS